MTNHHTTPSRTPALDDISDSEAYLSPSQEDFTEEQVNIRLTQAINYLHQKGGDDSPNTFIDRVNQIDDALVHELPRRFIDFDPRLYHRVQDMVRNAQDDYRATHQGSVPREEIPDDTPPSFVASEEIYQLEEDEEEYESPPTPTPIRASVPSSKFAASRRSIVDDKSVERQRHFSYGGTNNEMEQWYRDYPAALPFPETFLMEHWESMKIDSDLARSKEDFIFEADISLDHEMLKPYLQLKQFESGSRFKLPHVSDYDQRVISRYGTATKLDETIDELNTGRLDEHDGKGYAPNLFLEKFEVGRQDYPQIITHNDIRRSINRSPTTARMELLQSSSNEPQSNENKGPRKSPKPRSGPAARAITKAVKASLKAGENGSVTQSTPQKKPSPTPKKTVKAATASPKATSPAHSRPRKTSKKSAAKSPVFDDYGKATRTSTRKITKQPIIESPTESEYAESAIAGSSKRKRSAGALPYTPDMPRLKKTLRSAKKLKTTPKTTPAKRVSWVDLGPTALEEDYEDPRFVVVSPVDAVATRVKAIKSGKKARKEPGVQVQTGRVTRRTAKNL